MASISRRFWSTSKKPPQVAGALLDVVNVAEGLGGDHDEERIESPTGSDRKRTRGRAEEIPVQFARALC
jgi:hypothetical protein